MRALVLLFVLSTSPVLAQDATPGPQQGDIGMLFRFAGLSTGSYNGGVGAKYWAGSRTALTTGIQLEMRGNETEADEQETGRESTFTSAGVDIGVEFHAPRARFSPYVGLNLGVGGRSDRFTTDFRFSDEPDLDERATETVFVTAGLGVGAEYWLSPRFSVAAQQQLNASYSTGTERRTRTSDGIDTEQDVSGYSVGLSGSSLTLSVYF